MALLPSDQVVLRPAQTSQFLGKDSVGLTTSSQGVCSPAVSINSKAVYVCNRFENSVFLINDLVH
jgi:hypothetical protein